MTLGHNQWHNPRDKVSQQKGKRGCLILERFWKFRPFKHGKEILSLFLIWKEKTWQHNGKKWNLLGQEKSLNEKWAFYFSFYLMSLFFLSLRLRFLFLVFLSVLLNLSFGRELSIKTHALCLVPVFTHGALFLLTVSTVQLSSCVLAIRKYLHWALCRLLTVFFGSGNMTLSVYTKDSILNYYVCYSIQLDFYVPEDSEK